MTNVCSVPLYKYSLKKLALTWFSVLFMICSMPYAAINICNIYLPTYLQYDSKMISSAKLSYPIDEANVLAKPDFTICHCLIVEKITISS